MLSYAYPSLPHVIEAVPIVLTKTKAKEFDATFVHAGFVVEGFALSMTFPEAMQAHNDEFLLAACPDLAELNAMACEACPCDGMKAGGLNFLAILKFIKTLLDNLPI